MLHIPPEVLKRFNDLNIKMRDFESCYDALKQGNAIVVQQHVKREWFEKADSYWDEICANPPFISFCPPDEFLWELPGFPEPEGWE